MDSALRKHLAIAKSAASVITRCYHYILALLRIPRESPKPAKSAVEMPKKRIKIPETGLLLTQAVKSEGTNGFSAIELPHVMPVGASQHHKTMPEDAHLPRPLHSSMLSVCTLSCLSLPLCAIAPTHVHGGAQELATTGRN